MQDQVEETHNSNDIADLQIIADAGRLLAFDPGTKLWGSAVSDATCSVVSPINAIPSTNWKNLLSSIKELVARYDAAAVVIGLPLESDGSEGDMSRYARRCAEKLRLSIDIPVYLQDERVTTYEARRRLWLRGKKSKLEKSAVDSEAAAVILGDFLDRLTSVNR